MSMGLGRMVSLSLIGIIALTLNFNLVSAESEPNAFAPELVMNDTDGDTVDEYSGFIMQDETTVSLVPGLLAHDKDELGGARFICGYRIEGTYDIPFEAKLISHTDGKAKLKVKSGVDFSSLLRNKYKFQIAPFDCGMPTLHGAKAHVIITVLRTPPIPTDATPSIPSDLQALIDRKYELVGHKNKVMEKLNMEEPPIPEMKSTAAPTKNSATVYPKLPLPDIGGEQFFARNSYIVAMREGTLYDSILRLKPAADMSSVNICGYEIVTPNVPFAVDKLGNVKNTKALESAVQKSYIVSVVAKHCDGLVSKPSMINVQISEICANGWKDLPTDEEYKAGSKAIFPFAKTWFDTCTTTCAEEETLAVTVSLESDSNINTCEHDTYSIQSQRNTCGASPNTIDLLPQGKVWTKGLTEIKGHEAAYKFDGKTAIKVPSTESNHTLGKFFTIATWMQHGLEKKDGHKEHVLCNADGNSMNRHHYALFVHNCRLVFLLRKEADEVKSLDTFQPAEWRWSIPHVCDSKWHHYALSVTYPQVKLYVDGQVIQADKDVVEVVDDWALHPTNKVSFEQLTVGGCWKGETQTFGHYFDGSLAGLTLLTGTTETERAVKCLNSCGEKLQFHAMDRLTVGMSVSFNTELTELTIRGSDVDEVKHILQEVGYTNTNGNPKPGYRTLHVKTNATCDNKPLAVKEQTIPVLVSAIVDPKITISGVGAKQRTTAEFAEGVDVFTEVMIMSAPQKLLADQANRINKLDIEDVNTLQKDLKKRLTLDRCEVRVSQKMDVGHEILRLPTSLLVKYLMDTKEFDGGFDITGSESFTNYEAVIRETFYFNSKLARNFTSRTFSVKCTAMNGKFVSNSFDIKVGLMTDSPQSAALYADPKYAHIKAQVMSAEVNAVSGAHATVVSGSSAGTVAAVVVVCLAVLLTVIVVAVVRIKRVQGRKRENNPNVAVEDGPEMEWDNSTLNITVNPLESAALMQEMKGVDVCEDSEEEVMSSDSEDDEEAPKDGGLEWDNSSY